MTIEVCWDRLTAPEIRAVAARPDALAIVPVGSLEQHGPHLPVITDTASAHATAVRAAQRVAGQVPVLVLPGLWTGMSEHHLPFGGTISLNFTEFSGVLRGIVRSLRSGGFSRVLIVNGHGGNTEPLAVAAREMAHDFGIAVVATTPWYAEAKALEDMIESAAGVQHACEAETSMMLALTPDLVRREKLEAAAEKPVAAIPGRYGYSRFWAFSERAPATGVMGDPRLGTAGKGEKLLDAMAAGLAQAILDADLWRQPDPVWQAGRGQGKTVP